MRSADRKPGDNNRLDTNQLMPVLYDDLKKLAKTRLANEKSGNGLTASGLVHETFLRLFSSKKSISWDTEKHFFAAASRTMRRILIDKARRRNSLKRGGNCRRVDLNLSEFTSGNESMDKLLEKIRQALEVFAQDHPFEARLVRLRFYNGMTMNEVAKCLNLTPGQARSKWHIAKRRLQAIIRSLD